MAVIKTLYTDENRTNILYPRTRTDAVDGLDDALDAKQDAESGKGLSTNDYTTADKMKLADLENYDDTELSGRVSDIEAKEDDWDAKLDDAPSDNKTYGRKNGEWSEFAGGGGNVDDVKVNGTSVVSNKVANITVPTKVSDLTNDEEYQTADEVESAISAEDTAVKSWVENKGYSIVSETGCRIDLECDSSTYELKAKLYDKNNTLLSTSTVIDLPIESLIISVSYDNTTKELVITLKSGATVRVPIGAIISGLATQDYVQNYAYGKNSVYTKTEIATLLGDMATETWVESYAYSKTEIDAKEENLVDYIDASDTTNFDYLNEHKVEKVTGKGLSTNDYDNTEKTKVATALQPSALDDYRTADEQDEIDDALQPKIDILLSTESKEIVGAINEVKEEVGEKSEVSVSTTGTATTEAKYITVDGTEYKLGGGGGLPPATPEQAGLIPKVQSDGSWELAPDDVGLTDDDKMFSFKVNDEGRLILSATDATLAEYDFEIVNGHLMMSYEE